MPPDAIPVEPIPDEDILNRMIFFPGMKGKDFGHLDPLAVFDFPSDKNYAVSLVWRRHCPELDDVNRIGCQKQADDIRDKTTIGHQKYNKNLKPEDIQYRGSIQSSAGKIRNIRDGKGIVLSVEHAPENEQGAHHAEIRLVLPNNVSVSKQERKHALTEIKRRLFMIFSDLLEHSCSSISFSVTN